VRHRAGALVLAGVKDEPTPTRASLALGVALAVAVPTHAAIAAEPTAATTSDDDEQLREAQQLYREGLAAFETYDYPAAIEAWTRAYERVEGHPRSDQIRNGLVYNLAAARVAQYRIDGDRTQLRLAQQLLARYRGAVEHDASERAQIDAKLAEVEALLAEDEDDESATLPEPVATPAAPPRDAPPSDPPRTRRAGTGWIASGAVAFGAGVGLLAGMGVGLARGRTADRAVADPTRPAGELEGLQADGRRGNRIAIATGISGGVLVAAGVALVVIGAKRRGHSARVAHWTGEGLTWRF
jgi:hypothetical protein